MILWQNDAAAGRGAQLSGQPLRASSAPDNCSDGSRFQEHSPVLIPLFSVSAWMRYEVFFRVLQPGCWRRIWKIRTSFGKKMLPPGGVPSRRRTATVRIVCAWQCS